MIVSWLNVLTMAMEGTHIRFALDLKDRYLKIADLSAYLSGTVYPDSRYITKIDRSLTHGDEIKRLDPAKTDFELGMAVHSICDQLQGEIFKPYTMGMEPGGRTWWTARTAMKWLQDLDDIRRFPIRDYVPLINQIEPRHQEPLELLEKYNSLIRGFYSKDISLSSYVEFCAVFFENEAFAQEIGKQAHSYQTDVLVMEMIGTAHGRMLVAFDAGWKKDRWRPTSDF
ncbi:hypothetical protein HYV73_03960 [Candidatus Uhrbacteria bacterium]|nr:hypothetical protein [Candidatus Uhrbacteria bacterium]